jgi:hypothetical protein
MTVAGAGHVNGTVGSADVSGTLDGTGIVTHTLTLESGATLTPGTAGAGTLTAGTLVFNPGGTIAFTLNNTVALTQLSLGTLTQGSVGIGNYNIFLTGESGAAAGTVFDLINFTSNDPFTSGSSFTLGGSSAADGSLVLTNNQLDFVINTPPIPEPGTWAMLLGGVALLVIYQRRSRSN